MSNFIPSDTSKPRVHLQGGKPVLVDPKTNKIIKEKKKTVVETVSKTKTTSTEEK